MDRLPKKPPFPIGTRLRYIGPDRGGAYGCMKCHAKDGEHHWVKTSEPGMEIVIVEYRLGRQGTLRHCRDDDGPMYWEDTGKPILDETRDGYCLYQISCLECGSKQYGPIIDHENKKNWERASPTVHA